MTHSSTQYAHALWEALQEAADEQERSQIIQRFTRLLERRGAQHLLPAIEKYISGRVTEEAYTDIHIKTVDDDPSFTAGAEVYKGDYLVDNTLRSRVSRLARAVQS